MAQNDILYFKSDNKKIGKVKEISKDKILLESDVDSKTEKILKSDLVLVLFENGTYLTFPSEYKSIKRLILILFSNMVELYLSILIWMFDV